MFSLVGRHVFLRLLLRLSLSLFLCKQSKQATTKGELLFPRTMGRSAPSPSAGDSLSSAWRRETKRGEAGRVLRRRYGTVHFLGNVGGAVQGERYFSSVSTRKKPYGRRARHVSPFLALHNYVVSYRVYLRKWLTYAIVHSKEMFNQVMRPPLGSAPESTSPADRRHPSNPTCLLSSGTMSQRSSYCAC
jgi:hypothetical protein